MNERLYDSLKKKQKTSHALHSLQTQIPQFLRPLNPQGSDYDYAHETPGSSRASHTATPNPPRPRTRHLTNPRRAEPKPNPSPKPRATNPQKKPVPYHQWVETGKGREGRGGHASSPRARGWRRPRRRP